MLSVRTAAAIVAGLVLATLTACDPGSGRATQPADFLSYLDQSADGIDFSGDTEAKTLAGTDGLLAGPHFRLWFGVVDVDDETPLSGMPGSGGADNGNREAAEGYEFLVLYPKSSTPEAPGYERDPVHPVSAEVVVDGRARPVDELVRESSPRGLVVSVPKGHDATLRVTDEGRTQSFDLREGRRGTDAIPGYYRPDSVTWAATDGSYEGTATCTDALRIGSSALPVSCRADFTVDLNGFAGSLDAWTVGPGWARPGRIWLVLPDVAYSQVQPMISVAGGADFRLDPATTFGLVLPDGTRLAPASPAHVDGASDTFALLFDVPDGFTGGQLVIKPDGQLTLRGRPAGWAQPASAKQVPLSVHS